MSQTVVSTLLPAIAEWSRPSFNVFDVMRHGTHEKQLSNVFGWLLDAEGTHGLGDVFQRIFIDAVNRGRADFEPISMGSFSVRQEVNTSPPGVEWDIADLVLEDDATVLVVENYYTSDGHGHSYSGYLNYGLSGGKACAVVMLCESVQTALLADDWDRAAVVSYGDLIGELSNLVGQDATYRRMRPDQVTFIRHLHDRFLKGRTVDNASMIEFIDAMCTSGEAKHYRTQKAESAAVNFADSLREAALDQFSESRVLLQKVKSALRNYCAAALRTQLSEVSDSVTVTDVSANYAGIHQWTVNFTVSEGNVEQDAALQLKFGPSAWFAIEQDDEWKKKVVDADYSRLFLTRRKGMEIRQSSVSLIEVLDGLSADDFRLRDEFLTLIDGHSS